MFIVTVSVVSLVIFFNITVAQNQNTPKRTLAGKTWQSQDTTMFGYEPTTFVFGDGTFTMLEFHYSNTGTLVFKKNIQEGTFVEKPGTLTLVGYTSGTAAGSYSYKFVWISDTEFSISAGIQKFTFALQDSPEDNFTVKSIIPYLKQAIARKQITHPCFGGLIYKINHPMPENENTIDIVKVKSENNEVQIVKNESTTRTLVGKKWHRQTNFNNVPEPFITELLIFTSDSTFSRVQTSINEGPDGVSYGRIKEKTGLKYKVRNDSILFTEKVVFSKKFNTISYKIVWDDDNFFKLNRIGFLKTSFSVPYALYLSPLDVVSENHSKLYENY